VSVVCCQWSVVKRLAVRPGRGRDRRETSMVFRENPSLLSMDVQAAILTHLHKFAQSIICRRPPRTQDDPIGPMPGEVADVDAKGRVIATAETLADLIGERLGIKANKREGRLIFPQAVHHSGGGPKWPPRAPSPDCQHLPHQRWFLVSLRALSLAQESDTTRPQDYPSGSAAAHAGGQGDGLVRVKPLLDLVPRWAQHLSADPQEGVIRQLWRSESTDRPAGGERFVKRLERIIARTLRPGTPARKRKTGAK
jgi:hypothetical protein